MSDEIPQGSELEDLDVGGLGRGAGCLALSAEMEVTGAKVSYIA